MLYNKHEYILQYPGCYNRTMSAVTRLRDAQGDVGLRCPYMPWRHIFSWSVSYTCIYIYIVCLATFSWKLSLSLLMIEWCSLVLNFVMLSRFHCQEWLNACRQEIETPTFQKHARSDLGPFESSGTFPEQIAIIEMFSKFRKFPDCACF